MAAGSQLLIGDVFSNAARAAPHRAAAVLGDRSLSFGTIERTANQTVRALATLGVGRGARVVTWCPNDLGLVPVFAAAAKCGAVFAPLNPALGGAEVHQVMAAVDPALLVVPDGSRAETLKAAARSRTPAAIGIGELAALAARQEDTVPETGALSEREPHVVFFTSGSTGAPKGAVISHRVSFLRSHPGALLEPRGPMVCPYPLFHMGAWTIALQQWQARDTVVLLGSADPAAICDAVAAHRATRLNCIPGVWRRVLDHLGSPEGQTTDLTSLRVADTGTSATPIELLSAMQAALPHAQLRVFYGSTEAGSVAALLGGDVFTKPGSCGAPAPVTEVRLDDAGELWVRGPLLFDGYLNDTPATDAALVDGWFRTGDLARVDSEGYLSIVGRAGDVVRTGGESVVPAEVESVLAEHPGVADVAVVGLPDDRWGEVVCAVVVRSEDSPGGVTLDELRAHCAPRLARFKHPRRLVFVPAIPRTDSTSQVQRRLLADSLTGGA